MNGQIIKVYLRNIVVFLIIVAVAISTISISRIIINRKNEKILVDIEKVVVDELSITEFEQKYRSELIIYQDGEIVKATTRVAFEDVDTAFNQDAVFKTGMYESHGYQVYYAIYDSEEIYTTINLIVLFFVVLFASGLFVLIMYSYNYYRIMRLIKNLYIGLDKLSNFEFEYISQRNDQVSLILKEFVTKFRELNSRYLFKFQELEFNLEDTLLREVNKNELQKLVAHDMKTSLSIIRISTENQIIINQVEILNRDINQILSGEFALEDEFAYDVMLKEVIKEYKHLFDERELFVNNLVKLQFDVGLSLIEYRLIVRNLLTNIYTNASKGSEVFIESEIEDNILKMKFLNSVDNLDAIDLDKIFDITYSSSGSGFGLYSVKNRIEKSGGSVNVFVEDGLFGIELQIKAKLH